jgi:hypothetical protein
VLNRRQKQKVSDLIKQLRVSEPERANSIYVDQLQQAVDEETRGKQRRKAQVG